MQGDGTSASSGTGSATGVNAGFTLSSPVSNNITQIMDYSATDKHKTLLSRKNTSSVVVNAQAGRWANTAAITSIVCTVDSGATFSSGSTFSLYGVIA
jgi:hypothetical protein